MEQQNEEDKKVGEKSIRLKEKKKKTRVWKD